MAYVDSLVERVERLEAQNRRLSLCSAGVVILVAASWLSSAIPAPADELRAKSFVLLDDAGVERGGLTCGQGDPVLSLVSADKNRIAILGVGSSYDVSSTVEPRLVLRSQSGEGVSSVAIVAGAESAETQWSCTSGPDAPDSVASIHATPDEVRERWSHADSETNLFAREELAALTMEAGTLDSFGVTTLATGTELTALHMTWNDATTIQALCAPDDTHLTLSTFDDEADDNPNQVELSLRERKGRVTLRDEERREIFDAP